MRLKKVEKVYIEARYKKDSLNQIVKDLGYFVSDDKCVKVIGNYIQTLKSFEPQPPQVSEPPAPAFTPPNPHTLMIHETSDKKNSGVTIMTQAASEMADETKKGTSPTRYNSSSIFKIKKGKKSY